MTTKTVSRPWNMCNLEGDNAEITMYGEICSSKPIDWWTGEDLPGEYITPEGFLEDLETIKKANNIKLKLNSIGGDLYTGLAIHNALKTLNKNITVEIEGIAASAATIIACAGNTIKANAGSLYMIHGVAANFKGTMNLDDLKKQVKAFDKSEQAVAEVYSQKTGKPVDKLRSMMTKETWMTGREAFENGFIDELIEDKVAVVNMLGNDSLEVNGLKFNMVGHTLPKDLLDNITNKQKGGNNAMATLQEFLNKLGFSNAQPLASEEPNKKEQQKVETSLEKTQNDDLKKADNTENEIKARISNAVMQERKRCQEIDNLPNNVSMELKNEAKYGENPCNAGELAMYCLSESVNKNDSALKNLIKDTDTSNTLKVNGTSAPQDKNEDEPDKKVEEAKNFARMRKEGKLGK